MHSKTVLVLAIAAGIGPALAKVRRDLGRKNVEIAEIDADATIDEKAQDISFYDAVSDFEDVFRCTSRTGKVLTFTTDKKFAACCLPGQRLVGSISTAFDCCGEGHDITGSAETGYICCPIGQTYDGKVCKPANPPAVPVPDAKCESGLTSGKCYTFTGENGQRLGHHNNGYYTQGADSRERVFGVFQLCLDEKCTAGSPINPNKAFKIKDIRGLANGGQNPNQWLNDAKNGGHIGKTPDYAKAGEFTLTKWPCGKYCLGGIPNGIGPTCPSEFPSITFTTFDPQSCVPFDITEVPCDVHNVENNCVWKAGKDQCCQKIDCSEKA